MAKAEVSSPIEQSDSVSLSSRKTPPNSRATSQQGSLIKQPNSPAESQAVQPPINEKAPGIRLKQRTPGACMRGACGPDRRIPEAGADLFRQPGFAPRVSSARARQEGPDRRRWSARHRRLG